MSTATGWTHMNVWLELPRKSNWYQMLKGYSSERFKQALSDLLSFATLPKGLLCSFLNLLRHVSLLVLHGRIYIQTCLCRISCQYGRSVLPQLEMEKAFVR